MKFYIRETQGNTPANEMTGRALGDIQWVNKPTHYFEAPDEEAAATKAAWFIKQRVSAMEEREFIKNDRGWSMNGTRQGYRLFTWNIFVAPACRKCKCTGTVLAEFEAGKCFRCGGSGDEEAQILHNGSVNHPSGIRPEDIARMPSRPRKARVVVTEPIVEEALNAVLA